MSRFSSEAQLAASVVDWLKDQGFDVYQEVVNPYGRVDIVAKRGHITWAIEAKMSLGFSVFDQAINYLRYANYVSVATPSWPRSAARRFSELTGIGIICVTPPSDVSIQCPPRLNRVVVGIKTNLAEEQKSYGIAGSRGDYHSPFKATCRNVQDYVRKHNGCTLKELMEGVKGHHYLNKNALRSLMPGYIDKGLIPGVTVDRSQRTIRLIYTPGSVSGGKK